MGTPPPEIKLSLAEVKSIIIHQCPALDVSEIRLVDEGWDNWIYRINDTQAAKIPRRKITATLTLNEHQYLNRICRNLTIKYPKVLHAGQPMDHFPYPWSIVNWIEGSPATDMILEQDQFEILIDNLKALHQAAPNTAPINPLRGVSILQRWPDLTPRIVRIKEASSLWDDHFDYLIDHLSSLESPKMDRWIHGDLHAQNVIVNNGKLAGIIDWGDMTKGHPSTDLSCIWGLFEDPDIRRAAFARYGGNEKLILWSMAWALFSAIILYDTGRVDNPRHKMVGENIFNRLKLDCRINLT